MNTAAERRVYGGVVWMTEAHFGLFISFEYQHLRIKAADKDMLVLHGRTFSLCFAYFHYELNVSKKSRLSRLPEPTVESADSHNKRK